jgi:hypothetical protein
LPFAVPRLVTPAFRADGTLAPEGSRPGTVTVTLAVLFELSGSLSAALTDAVFTNVPSAVTRTTTSISPTN